MITPEQAADLMAGDVVRYAGHPGLNGATIEGPLYDDAGMLLVGDGFLVRHKNGKPYIEHDISLAIVIRAPRPLYVNHTRTEPVNGDLAKTGSGKLVFRTRAGWFDHRGEEIYPRHRDGLHLVVDGETGEPVP